MLTIEYAKDPVWSNTENTFITLVVKFKEFSEEMPFGASPLDPMPYGVELFNRAKAEEFGEVAAFIPPTLPTTSTTTT